MRKLEAAFSTGERDSESLAASLERENSDQGLKTELKEQNAHQAGDLVEEADQQQAAAGGTMLKLSPSQEQDESELAADCEQNSDCEESSVKPTDRAAEQDRPGVFSFEGVGENYGQSYSEDEIEPSTDEELRLWRYPHDRVAGEAGASGGEGLEISTMEAEDGCRVAEGSAVSITGSSEEQDDEEPRPGEEKMESALSTDRGNVECNEEAVTGAVDVSEVKPEQKDAVDEDDVGQQPDEEPDPESAPSSSVAEPPESEASELETKVDDAAEQEMESDSPATDGGDGAQRDEVEEGVVAEQTEQTRRAEGKGSSKKVTFRMEPEFIRDSSLSESRAPEEASVSGETPRETRR